MTVHATQHDLGQTPHTHHRFQRFTIHVVVFVILAAVALELITIAEEF